MQTWGKKILSGVKSN